MGGAQEDTGLVAADRVMSEQRQQEVRSADKSESGTFLEGHGLCCCLKAGSVSVGFEGSEKGGEREDRGTTPSTEEVLHAPGSPPSETADHWCPSSCRLRCGRNQDQSG